MEEISQDYCVCAYNLSHTRTQQFARNALLYTAVPLGEITYTFANRNESVIRCPAVFEEQHRAELTAYRAAQQPTQPSLPAGTAMKGSGHLSGRGPSILLTQDRSVA